MWNLSKTYLPLLATASLLTLAACNTIDEEYKTPTEEPAAVLNINILAPNNIITRADENRNVLAEQSERTLHDIQVWAYRNASTDGDKTKPIGYAEVSNANTYGETTMTMLLPENMLDGDNLKPLDLYILSNVNGLSTLEKPADMITRNELKTLTFGRVENKGDDYGLTTAFNSVPGGGLPISQVRINENIQLMNNSGNLLYRNSSPIILTRAISKMRFFFAKTTGVENVSIDKIVINGGAFPTTQYIFPKEVDGAVTLTEANLPADVTYEEGKTIV